MALRLMCHSRCSRKGHLAAAAGGIQMGPPRGPSLHALKGPLMGALRDASIVEAGGTPAVALVPTRAVASRAAEAKEVHICLSSQACR